MCRGRFFDASTLPPRTQIIRPLQSETIPQTSHIPHNIHTIHQQNLKSTSPPPTDTSPPKYYGSPDRPTSPALDHGGRGVEAGDRLGERKDVLLDRPASGRGGEVEPAGQGPEEQIRNKVTTSISSEQRCGRGQRSGEDSPSTTGPKRQEPEPGGELDPSSSFQQGTPDGTKSGRSPPVLAPISITADPQSSPASTNGAGSSNTPDAAAGSPTTSPGDEQAPEDLNGLARDEPREATSDASKPMDLTSSSRLNFKPSGNFTAMQPPVDAGRHDSSSRPRITSMLGSPNASDQKSTAARKPIMRIDTQSVATSNGRPKETNHLMESPMSLNSASTPRRVHSSASFSFGQSPPGRITRISSGTIRHRSVSEILGERPKLPSPSIEKSSAQTFIPTPAREAFETSTRQGRLADRKEREKDRSKLSTVVFAKQQHALDSSDSAELLRKVSGEVTPFPPEQRDYLHTLFESKAYSPPRGQSLNTLLQSAHKTLSTADHLVDYQEQMNCRTLKRIYQLQNANRWPLRQMERAPEPSRQTSHWDFLLDHAKWMRTDFREERKWKVAAARGVAEWCAEWVSSSPRRRQQLQVKVRPPQATSNILKGEDIQMEDRFEAVNSPIQQTPDLVPSAENESISDEFVDEIMDLRASAAPAAIFSLGASDFSFPMTKTPATDKLLSELPFYEPARFETDLTKSDLAERSDSKWKTDIIPISRFATEKIRYRPPKAPSKRSRYDYEEEDSSSKDSKSLPPEQTNVALFMPENKHIRDRIHPGHSFRPPSEYQMPAQAFFESRASSQWTQTEDDELRKLVKDYSYNWSLISSCLSTRSPFHSGADRRTPWECFERWINLEGLPADMSKTPYFRAYHSRIEAAGRHVIAQQEAAQRQAGGNPALTARKRTTQPIRVERKKNQRHLAMLDAMRKLAKKRETALQKQQHGKIPGHPPPLFVTSARPLTRNIPLANTCIAADLAAMRKANEADRPRPPYSTPAEFSRLKHEREVKLAERQEIYRLQVLAQQKVLKLLPSFNL
jgi:chromatin modification-related protein VID21